VSERGGPLNYHVTARTLSRWCGAWACGGRPAAVGLHALRHTFAVNRLFVWYRRDVRTL